MHKYRAAAKRSAWYSEEDDPNPNYNPFRKIRSYEHDLPTLHRAQPLHSSTAPVATQSDEDVSTDEKAALPTHEEDPQAGQTVFQTPEHATEDHEYGDAEQGIAWQGITRSRRAFAPWKSWTQQRLSHVWRQIVLASGSRNSGDVKRGVADMGMAVINHAPLGTKGAPFFQPPGRRSRFMVIEYANQAGNIIRHPQGSADIVSNSTRSAINAFTGVKVGVPLLRFFEKVSPRDGDKQILDKQQTDSKVESLCAELMHYLSSVGYPLRSRSNGRLFTTNKRERSQQAHQI